MRLNGLKFDSTRLVNDFLKTTFDEIFKLLSLPPNKGNEAIPQLDKNEEYPRPALRALMRAQNSFYKEEPGNKPIANRTMILEALKPLIKKYQSAGKKPFESKTDNSVLSDDFEILFANPIYMLFCESFDPKEVPFIKAQERIIEIARQKNDIFTEFVVSKSLGREGSVLKKFVAYRCKRAALKTAMLLKTEGLILNDKDVVILENLIADLSLVSNLKKTLIQIAFEGLKISSEELLIQAVEERREFVDSMVNPTDAFVSFLLDHGVKAKREDIQVDLLTKSCRTNFRATFMMLKQIVNLNSQDKEGNTVLMHVVKHDISNFSDAISFSDNWDIVEAMCLLLGRGINPNIKNSNGDTALIVAASYHAYNPIMVMLDRDDVEIEAQNKQGDTALIAAVNSNLKRTKSPNKEQEDIFQGIFILTLRALIKNGADIDAKNNNGDTALLVALKASDRRVAEILLHHGANPTIQDSSGQTASQLIEKLGIERFELKDFDPNATVWGMFRQSPKIKATLDEKKDDTTHSLLFGRPRLTSSPISCVIKSKHQVLKFNANDIRILINVLAKFGVKANRSIVEDDDERAFSLMFKTHKEKLNIYIQSKLIKTEIGADDVGNFIAKLAELDVTVDRSSLPTNNEDAFNSLFTTYQNKIKYSSLNDFLTHLREREVADAIQLYCRNIVNEEDRAWLKLMLILSIRNGRTETAITLLKFGIDPNTVDRAGDEEYALNSSALHIAVSRYNTTLVKALLEHGADINAVDANGCSALIFAIKLFYARNFGMPYLNKPLINDEIINLLIKKGARFDIKDVRGDTALLHAARIMKGVAIRDLFREVKSSGMKSMLEEVNKLGQTPLLAVITQHINSRLETIEDVKKLSQSSLSAVTSQHKSTGAEAKVGAVPEKISNPYPKLHAFILRPLNHNQVNFNAQDSKGNTALMEAVRGQDLDLAEYLLNHGADPFIQNKEGESALDQSLSSNQNEMAKLILFYIRIGQESLYKPDELTKLDKLLKKYSTASVLFSERITAKKNAVTTLLQARNKRNLLALIGTFKCDPNVMAGSINKNMNKLLGKIETRLVQELKEADKYVSFSSLDTKNGMAPSQSSCAFISKDSDSSAPRADLGGLIPSASTFSEWNSTVDYLRGFESDGSESSETEDSVPSESSSGALTLTSSGGSS